MTVVTGTPLRIQCLTTVSSLRHSPRSVKSNLPEIMSGIQIVLIQEFFYDVIIVKCCEEDVFPTRFFTYLSIK